MKIAVATRIVILALTTASHSLAATFGNDTSFLQKHGELIVLSDKSGAAKVAVVPAWQGRVVTSTAGGDGGLSFGWINRELITSKTVQPHINVFGGEDRFWLGPEGGQFSIFFAKGAKFELADWFTPKAIDTIPWRVVSKSSDKVLFSAEFSLTNYSGTRFDLKVKRQIELLNREAAWLKLGSHLLEEANPMDTLETKRSGGGFPAKPPEDIQIVAYESQNGIVNSGKNAWKKESGLLSIWILGMFNPSPQTTIVVPIRPGPDSQLGSKVTSDYFGSIPSERLTVQDNVIYFSGDGQFRSKIGISPKRSKSTLGSYDAANHVLTVVQFTQRPGATDYVNSLWKLQDNPYGGDAANSYNDGPPAPGAKPLGPFYELESSSPAAALAPGQSLGHIHRTTHLTGPEPALDSVAKHVFGVSLADITQAIKR